VRTSAEPRHRFCCRTIELVIPSHRTDLPRCCGSTSASSTAKRPGIARSPKRRLNPDTDGVWIRLRGETDITTYEQLLAELATVDLDGMHVGHVDLSGLAFCDERSMCATF
jgi:hypothetical protein